MRRLLALYPVLIGIFFVLTLYKYNIPDILSYREILSSLLVVIVSSLVCLGIARVGLRNWDRASLVVAYLVVFVLSYGYVQQSVGMGWALYLMAGLGLLVILVLLVLSTLHSSTLRVLAVVGSCISGSLVLVVLVGIGFSGLGSSLSVDSTRGVLWEEVSSKPDIYYLVFDKYTNMEVLEEHLGYDNSEFLDHLEGKGFVVSNNAYSNYSKTEVSLASSLSMQYWTSEALNMQEGQAPFIVMNDNEVFRVLKEGGYRCIYLGNWHGPTALNSSADLNLVYGTSSDFSNFLLESSVFYPLADRLFKIEGDKYLRYRKTTLFQFETLMKIPSVDGPKFVYAHILLPHGPFIFRADGSMPSEEEILSPYKEAYLNQIEFTNMKIREVVEVLLRDSSIPPIIILQADEGTCMGVGNPYWSSAQQKTYQEVSVVVPKFAKWTMGILDAKYLPGMPLEEARELKSPVNTFRGIFNYYFGAEYELLPDKYYYLEKYRYPYILLDITEEILEWRGSNEQ